jgi:uncharacterized protein (DUF2336 family)
MEAPSLFKPAPGLDATVFLEVISSGDAAQRTLLAVQLAAFFSDPESPAKEVEQTVPAVLKLAVDPVMDVRRALAEGLAYTLNLHQDIVFSIVADVDEIALPFLASTPSLNPWHMQAILRVGDTARQRGVALREDITPEAIRLAVDGASLEACLTLFQNPSVQFDSIQYHTLFKRFGQDQAMIERLLACPDLPLDIRILQTKRASSRMHMMVTERGWIPAHDASEILADAEESAILKLLVEASDEELGKAVPFLVSRGMLTGSIVVRAAVLGDMHVVEWAMAHLSGYGLARTSSMMMGSGFRSLFAKAGLPQTCYGLLQAACDVAREAKTLEESLDPQSFGRRLIEALMTGYAAMPHSERARHLDMIGRFGEERVRLIAKRLKMDLARAA